MARVTVVPETIDYPDSDGLPMAESESQFWPILYVAAALDRYYQARDDVYVVGNLLLYYQEGDLGKSVSPDLMVVFGAPKHIRSSYRLWEEPKAPDFVLEIASESTHRIDRGEKRDLYAGMGVSEYWQYDPVGDYLEPPLLGFRLVEGRYAPISAAAQEGGMLALRSEVLGLELRLVEGRYAPISAAAQEGGMLALRSEVLGLELRLTSGAPVREALHFYDPLRGEYLRTYREAEARLEQAEDRLEQTEGQLRQTQDRLREEQSARQALEDELRELRQRGR